MYPIPKHTKLMNDRLCSRTTLYVAESFGNSETQVVVGRLWLSWWLLRNPVVGNQSLRWPSSLEEGPWFGWPKGLLKQHTVGQNAVGTMVIIAKTKMLEEFGEDMEKDFQCASRKFRHILEETGRPSRNRQDYVQQ